MNRLGKVGLALVAVGALVALNAGTFQERVLIYGFLILGLGTADAGILLFLVSDKYG
jgi:hypothetical protein